MTTSNCHKALRKATPVACTGPLPGRPPAPRNMSRSLCATWSKGTVTWFSVCSQYVPCNDAVLYCAMAQYCALLKSQPMHDGGSDVRSRWPLQRPAHSGRSEAGLVPATLQCLETGLRAFGWRPDANCKHRFRQKPGKLAADILRSGCTWRVMTMQ